MNFDETTLEQATAFHEFFVGAGERRLRDLAWAMRDSPEIELMDGTFDSLVPLWRWARAQAGLGLPSVPSFARPTAALFLGEPANERDRYDVLGEIVERYMLETALLQNPRLVWAIGIRSTQDEWAHHRTALRTPNGGFFTASGVGKQLWRHANQLGPRKRDDMLFLTVTGDYHEGVSTPTGPSMLTPFLGSPPLAWDDPARFPPLASDFGPSAPAVPAREPGGSAVGETELIFAAIGTDVERLERANPLEEAAVAAVLADLGFEAEEPGLEHWLRAPEAEIVHASGGIMVDVFAHRTRLRALHFELHGSDEDNLAAVAAFTALGLRLRARLGSEDDWTNT